MHISRPAGTFGDPAWPAAQPTSKQPAPSLQDLRDARGGGKSALAGVLPETGMLRAGRMSIPTKALALAAGQCAWFKLRRYEAVQDEELSLVGWQIVALPPNVDGAWTPGTSAPLGCTWGDNRGLGAAIVIGTNLPGPDGEWFAGPAIALGLNSAADDVYDYEYGNVLTIQSFPPGKLADDYVVKPRMVGSFGVSSPRITAGQPLDVCLLVDARGANPVNVAGRHWYGFVQVEITAQKVETGSRFASM